jgi:hypothetical protein
MVAQITDRAPAGASHHAGPVASLRRGLAAGVLVASILPVLYLGPSLLRAPLKLARELHTDVQRLVARPEVHARAKGAVPR